MFESAPTVVLVHGAFADGSSWNGVIERLHAKSVSVKTPANPLRGISIDSAYIAGFFDETPGPIVAVGHAYGGAVITNAATRSTKVAALVYVAAFAPDAGETLGDAQADSNESILTSVLVPRHYPAARGADPGVEFEIDPARFRDALAADLAAEQTALMAVTQRPIAELAFSEASGPPAWKRLPSWAVVASGDRAAGADVIRSMAERAGATIAELDGSHLIMVSQPQAVTASILDALDAVSGTRQGPH